MKATFHQPFLPALSPVTEALSVLANSPVEARGAIFTRREVVDFILDLISYTPDRPLHMLRLLEPSFGDGDFLLPAIQRLMTAWQSAHSQNNPVNDLADSICGVELHRTTFENSKDNVVRLLKDYHLSTRDAQKLADRWLIQGDFLLEPLPGSFDFVTGNPPYVRQELIPDALISEYRDRYHTIYDRADLYIPFIERSLTSLAHGGQLGFICSDRWMKNRYGGPLRGLVAQQFHLKIYVDMVNTPAFQEEVIAYPAITIIEREKPGPTRIAHQPHIDAKNLASLSALLLASGIPNQSPAVRQVEQVAVSAEPWILGSSDQLALVRRLEAEFPTVEEAGCKVGIGVATGADKAFIGNFEALDVEPDRKLRLAMTGDILSGVVKWRGLGVINPFNDAGGLVDLNKFPRLKRYLEERKTQIAQRHVAKKAPSNWYRTIDRIYPVLADTPKLLIPDIKGEAHIVYEDGMLYPHHNLYFIVSEQWDLKALQAVLLSGIARLFVSTYSTKMRGGYLRFQAQYLRRIRIPHWRSIPGILRQELIEAGDCLDIPACNRAAASLYKLNNEETAVLQNNGN